MFDESHRLKDTGTQRYKRALKLANRVARVVCMTGTPAPERLLDVFGAATIATRGKAFGHAFSTFRARFFYPIDPNGHMWRPFPNTSEELVRVMEPWLRRVENTAKDGLLRVMDYRITPPPQLVKIYKAFQKDFFVGLEGGEMLLAESAATLSTKLQQLSSGFVYAEDNTIRFSDFKLEALKDLLEDLQGAQAIIVFTFVEQLLRLKDVFPELGYLAGETSKADAERWINAFNDGSLRLLAIHPASAGEGLNLHLGGAHHLIYLSLPWSAGQYDQVNGRLARFGQQKTVVVHRFLAESTLDETIAGALETKADVQQHLLECAARAKNIRKGPKTKK
ncbi:MAG: DEAD/DEAH box helicase [Myxococcales bacterium]|nr:DEAD/DEAH box helicase [Myxococcales bacterium]